MPTTAPIAQDAGAVGITGPRRRWVRFRRMPLVFTTCTATSLSWLRIAGTAAIGTRPRTAAHGFVAIAQSVSDAAAPGTVGLSSCAPRTAPASVAKTAASVSELPRHAPPEPLPLSIIEGFASERERVEHLFALYEKIHARARDRFSIAVAVLFKAAHSFALLVREWALPALRECR